MELMLAPGLGRVASFPHGFVDTHCGGLGAVHVDGDVNAVVVDVLGIGEDALQLVSGDRYRGERSVGTA